MPVERSDARGVVAIVVLTVVTLAMVLMFSRIGQNTSEAIGPAATSPPPSSVSQPSPPSTPSTTDTEPTAAPSPSTTSAANSSHTDGQAWIEAQLATLTLEDKIAQLMIVEFTGSDASSALSMLDQHRLGGFILKSANNNLTNENQTRQLISDLQGASQIPLFIAVDQEGGRVDRVQFESTTRFPAPALFGELDDTRLVEDAAWATGVQLKSLGFNTDFAPVADVNTLGQSNPAIGDRSYGPDPERTADMTAAAVRGFNAAGIASAAKHFPGHGRTTVDSHLGLPEIDVEYGDWTTTDRIPFDAAIEAGVPMIMVGHISFPAVDAEGMPSTLSIEVVSGQLRNVLGYRGVIVTDDLAGMDALAEWSRPNRAVLALSAGADLLLNPGDVEGSIAAIADAVESETVPEMFVDESLRRVLGLKWALGLADWEEPAPLPSSTGEAIGAVAEQIGEACEAAKIEC